MKQKLQQAGGGLDVASVQTPKVSDFKVRGGFAIGVPLKVPQRSKLVLSGEAAEETWPESPRYLVLATGACLENTPEITPGCVVTTMPPHFSALLRADTRDCAELPGGGQAVDDVVMFSTDEVLTVDYRVVVESELESIQRKVSEARAQRSLQRRIQQGT